MAQDPHFMTLKALEVGHEVLQDRKPAEPTLLIEPKLITRENVGTYQGWTSR